LPRRDLGADTLDHINLIGAQLGRGHAGPRYRPAR
jgi:hypothetical protein